MEGTFISLACHLCPLFRFFALLPQRILSKSQDYPGEIAHAEKNLAARHSRGVQFNHTIYTDYKKSFQPFHTKDIRHNSSSFPPSHFQAILFSVLPPLTAGITFHRITHLEKAEHHLLLLPQTYFSFIFLQNT